MKFNSSLIDIINTALKIRVLRHILKHEAPMSEREIASIVKVSHMSINRTLRELAEFNLVTFVTTGKAHLWKINKKSYWYQPVADVLEGIAATKPPFEDLKKRVHRALAKQSVKRAVLFGSVAQKNETASSDIDLFILVAGDAAKRAVTHTVEELSNECFDIYGNRLSGYILTEKEFAAKKNTPILESVRQGILLMGER